MNKKLSVLFFCLIAVTSALMALSFAIAVPIYFRPFYYHQVDSLNMVEESGFDRDVIIDAYDELLDCLTWGKPFGTGELHYSESGRSHFMDCKVLFDLDRNIFLASAGILIITLIVKKKLDLPSLKLKDRFGPTFFGGIGAVLIPALFAIYAVTDFDRAFEFFHKIFFPGKTNWVFDPYEDEIILVMPEQFFANCGILIGLVLLLTVTGLIVFGLRPSKKRDR